MTSVEEWKKITLEYIEKNKNKDISIFEIFSLYGLVPTTLKSAVEELEKEGAIGIVKDKEGKKWLKYKETTMP